MATPIQRAYSHLDGAEVRGIDLWNAMEQSLGYDDELTRQMGELLSLIQDGAAQAKIDMYAEILPPLHGQAGYHE